VLPTRRAASGEPRQTLSKGRVEGFSSIDILDLHRLGRFQPRRQPRVEALVLKWGEVESRVLINWQPCRFRGAAGRGARLTGTGRRPGPAVEILARSRFFVCSTLRLLPGRGESESRSASGGAPAGRQRRKPGGCCASLQRQPVCD
jgi:hypothetical protein